MVPRPSPRELYAVFLGKSGATKVLLCTTAGCHPHIVSPLSLRVFYLYNWWDECMSVPGYVYVCMCMCVFVGEKEFPLGTQPRPKHNRKKPGVARDGKDHSLCKNSAKAQVGLWAPRPWLGKAVVGRMCVAKCNSS